jgi:5'-nucleotidase
MQKLHILVTNDDGINSEGLVALRRALSPLAEISIIAPERNWSVSGHTKTLDRPLRISEVELSDGGIAYSTDGTPSDCVSLAVLGFLKRKPHLVVAGINKGANLAEDITYSGTVAAAMEGVISGLPSVAVSLCSSSRWKFDTAASFAARVVEEIQKHGMSGDVLLNVNVPALQKAEIKGIAITHLGKRIYTDTLVERTDPLGRKYYWIGGGVPAGDPEEGTDIGAIAAGKVSITPIHLDLTSYRLVSVLEKWDLNI